MVKNGLVSKQTVDKNGRVTTVWVKPGQDAPAKLDYARTLSGPPRPMNAVDQRRADLGDQLSDDDMRVVDCIEHDGETYHAKEMPFMNIEADPDPENALKGMLAELDASEVEYEIAEQDKHGGLTVNFSSDDPEVIAKASSYLSEGPTENVNTELVSQYLEAVHDPQ